MGVMRRFVMNGRDLREETASEGYWDLPGDILRCVVTF